MGISPDGAGGGSRSLGRTAEEEWSTEKGVGRVGVERAVVMVVDQSVDWNASFASSACSILRCYTAREFSAEM